MRLWKKTLSVGLSLAMCASMVAPAFAASFADLTNAIATGESVYQEDGTTYKIEASKDAETGAVNVKLHEDVKFDVGNKNEYKSIKILKGENVAIDLNGHDIDGQGKSESVISIAKGGELTLTDSTAEWVEDEDGNKTLESGAITGGYYGTGGGVYNAGTFTMEDCVIKDNKAYTGGGGVYNAGTFNMESGVIKGNTGGASGAGGGVYNSGTANTANMKENSFIEGNTAGTGGGVYSQGIFNMEGGVIKDNTASNSTGGGVCNMGTFNMENGAIVDNTSKMGGGGVFNQKTFNMNDGTIAGNTGSLGGGVSNKNTFNMTGGIIEGNTATSKGADFFTNKPLNVPDDSLWEQDDGKGSKIYQEKDLESIKSSTYLKHHEHKFADAEITEPTCTEAGVVVHSGCVCGQPVIETIEALGHDMGEWKVTTPAQPGVEGEETSACQHEGCDYVETQPIEALPDLPPVATTSTTEIDDVEVPLAAGPVTRAEFIDYLWRHEDKPTSNRVCTFADVSADHEYVLALAWAEQNGIAVADEDGNFQPDELVTVAAVREFLGNFARVFGMNVDVYALVTLTGEDAEAVLNCDEVLAEFFGEELAEQAA
ncbi:MAG: S-layer homology domain-containing protein [Oscillospiraceae bacterium]|nr:S-layer homology domain-containing protein [Oscillospiraceae bacterium]